MVAFEFAFIAVLSSFAASASNSITSFKSSLASCCTSAHRNLKSILPIDLQVWVERIESLAANNTVLGT